jgi:CheY-like chemotaxis protein
LKHRILVVDDDADIREVTMLLLAGEGYDVASAADGIDALAWIAANPKPELIVLDLRMPRMSGGEFLHALRQDPTCAAIPIVVLSGDVPATQSASALGAQAYLGKPVDLDTLLAVVARLL